MPAPGCRPLEPARLNLTQEVAAARAFPTLSALVQYWAAVAGPAFAARALAQAWSADGLLESWQSRGSPPEEEEFHAPLGPWLTLRRIVAATTDFAEARDTAVHLRAQSEPALRTALAVAFPRENWAEEEAVLYLRYAHSRHDAPDYGLLLLLALKDPALSLGVMLATNRKALGFPPCWTYTMVALVREQAVNGLQRMLAMSLGDPRRARVVVEALSVVVTRAAAMVMAEHLHHPDRLVQRVAWLYLKRWPELARQVCHQPELLRELEL